MLRRGSKFENRPIKRFSVRVSPKNIGINLDGWEAVVFTNDNDEAKELAWLGYVNKDVMYVYTGEFEFDE